MADLAIRMNEQKLAERFLLRHLAADYYVLVAKEAKWLSYLHGTLARSSFLPSDLTGRD